MLGSIDINMILGLHRLPGSGEITGVTVTGDGYVIPGTPGLSRIVNPEDGKKEIRVLFPFPYQRAGKPRTISVYRTHDVSQRTCGDYTKTHRFITMPSFCAKSVKRILPTVAKHGVVTAIMSKRGAISFIRSLENVTKLYKYHNIFYSDRYYVNETEAEQAVPIISFFDIRHCISIFNSRKVDGLGILYETVLPSASERGKKLVTTSVMGIVLSQFRENLFYVDGKEIREQIFLTKGNVKSLLDVFESGQNEEAKAKAKKPEKEEKSWWGDTNEYNTASVYFTYTSSKTTNYLREEKKCVE